MKALFDFTGLAKACFDRGGDSGILEKWKTLPRICCVPWIGKVNVFNLKTLHKLSGSKSIYLKLNSSHWSCIFGVTILKVTSLRVTSLLYCTVNLSYVILKLVIFKLLTPKIQHHCRKLVLGTYCCKRTIQECSKNDEHTNLNCNHVNFDTPKIILELTQ